MAFNYYLRAFQKYSDFKGRATRSEYWYFFLFSIIFTILAVVLDNVLNLNIPDSPYGVFYFAYLLIALIPGLS